MKKKVLRHINEVAKNNIVEFFLGEYGEFDTLSRMCSLKYKGKYKNAKLTFVTPYILNNYSKNKIYRELGFDEILYPELENTPYKYSIIKRNHFMIERADVIIFYVKYYSDASSKLLNYARKKNKKNYTYMILLNEHWLELLTLHGHEYCFF